MFLDETVSCDLKERHRQKILLVVSHKLLCVLWELCLKNSLSHAKLAKFAKTGRETVIFVE